jgi:hypothetical protein
MLPPLLLYTGDLLSRELVQKARDLLKEWSAPNIMSTQITDLEMQSLLEQLRARACLGRYSRKSSKKSTSKSIKSDAIKGSWIANRDDLTHLVSATVSKIAGHWITFVDWWFINISSSLKGLAHPKTKQMKDFASYRRTCFTPGGIKLNTLCQALSGVHSGHKLLSQKYKRKSKGYKASIYKQYPGLQNHVLGLYAEMELEMLQLSRYRCGLNEIFQLEEYFDLHFDNMCGEMKVWGRWLLDFLAIANIGAFRGSELLKSRQKCDNRAWTALWRREHRPAMLSDCRIEGMLICIYLRDMKNRRYYKNNKISFGDPAMIAVVLRIHKCETLQKFGELCTAESTTPFIGSPWDESLFTDINLARKWLKTLLMRIVPHASKLRKINIHSPRAGFANVPLVYFYVF